MPIFVSDDCKNLLREQYVLLDNDFIGEIFNDENCFENAMELLSQSYLMVEPLTKFEFLRDIFIPRQRELREKFIAQEIFIPTPLHSDIYKKIFDNALTLSKIYSHHKEKNRACPSVIDLILASRMVLIGGRYLLITSNAKDFPGIIFDVIGTIVVQQKGDGTLKTFGILKLNLTKFNLCIEELSKLEKTE